KQNYETNPTGFPSLRSSESEHDQRLTPWILPYHYAMQVSASVRAVQVPDDNPMHPVFTTIYLVGRDQVLTIDSGEDMERYRWMLKGYLAASERAEIAVSAVTHHHRDHSSNLKWLRDEFRAEIYVVEAAAGLLTEQLPPTGVHRTAGARAIDAGGASAQVLETT